MDHNRRKVLRLSTDFVARFFGAGIKHFECIDDIVPADGRIVDARYNGFGHTVDVLIESESFDPVPEGSQYPEFNPTFRTIHEPFDVA